MPKYSSAGLRLLQLLHRQESYCGGINGSIPHRSQGKYLIPHQLFALATRKSEGEAVATQPP